MTHGENALKYGHYQAFFKMPSPSSKASLPTYVVRFAIWGDPHVKRDLEEMSEAIASKMDSKIVPGKFWKTNAAAGWQITDPGELLDFGETMWNRAGYRDQYPEHEGMLEAWLACVKLLPKFARESGNGSYSPRRAIPARQDALTKFFLARLQEPAPLARFTLHPDF